MTREEIVQYLLAQTQRDFEDHPAFDSFVAEMEDFYDTANVGTVWHFFRGGWECLPVLEE